MWVHCEEESMKRELPGCGGTSQTCISRSQTLLYVLVFEITLFLNSRKKSLRSPWIKKATVSMRGLKWILVWKTNCCRVQYLCREQTSLEENAELSWMFNKVHVWTEKCTSVSTHQSCNDLIKLSLVCWYMLVLHHILFSLNFLTVCRTPPAFLQLLVEDLHGFIVNLEFFFVSLLESEIRPARLLTWCQKQTEGYRNVAISDLTSSWQSGFALCALIHRFKPQLMYVTHVGSYQQQPWISLIILSV